MILYKMTKRMSDAAARRAAVEPGQSVIVQAPAGSGKTTLLVERYLALLGTVDAPEEVLAITFTRKAAAEMRQRVLRLLASDFQSDAPHEQSALANAKAVADKVAQWRLIENPQRLLIRTIDSFNHFLARSMPVASSLGPVPGPSENAQVFYRQAARNVLGLIDSSEPIAADLHRVLAWRDHRSQDIENLLTEMLARRDQWLRALHVTGNLQRSQLEGTLHELVCGQLATAEQALITTLQQLQIEEAELVELLQFAGRNLHDAGSASEITQLASMPRLPGRDAADLPLWRGLAEALLTRAKQAQFRKTVNKSSGFPAGSAEKERFCGVLETLAEFTSFGQLLHRVARLPSPVYTDDEWSVLDALVRVLVRTAAELELCFAHSGQTDYTGLAAAALRGLGDDQQGYTDLGLYLDRRIQHLLVDEFQDTNWAQLHLLEKLTAGWEQGDGRSLFLVGDPMQSIYRFREAEVGLFMRCRDQGIGGLVLTPQQLTSNFRSQPDIVAWVNHKLGPIFPQQEDIAAGAVAYAPSEPGRSGRGRVQTTAHTTALNEADAIAQFLKAELAERADDNTFSAAIIVRARSHLNEILPALARCDIPYRAVKLDPLTSRSVVQDLLAITKAVLYPSDTTAVLAMLRAPTCGLSLSDLHALAGDGRSPFAADALERLSGTAHQRATRVFSALQQAQQNWQRRSIVELVDGVWQHLGGPHCCVQPATDLADAALFLDVLERADSGGLLHDWNDFLEMLEAQQTEGDPPSPEVKLEVLTMHGAKGLEWDLVVLPALERRPAGSETSLLHWLPFNSASQQEQVLLAPLRASDQATNSPLVELIRHQQRTRGAYENQRLLYVATTRAKQHMMLSAVIEADTEESLQTYKAPSGSLLADLWPTCAADFRDAWTQAARGQQGLISAPVPEPMRDQGLRRVADHWSPPVGEAVTWQPLLLLREQKVEVEFNWAGIDARRTGTVLHRLLEEVGRIGVENLDTQQRMRLRQRIRSLLAAMGGQSKDAHNSDIDNENVAAIEDAFDSTLDSQVGRWILSQQHTQGACELTLAGVLDGEVVNAVIDRTFVDAEGVRWIIDYKSGYHAGADLQDFLDREADRYREQLRRYRRLFEQLESRPVKTALYLPRHGRLIEVQT